MPIYYRMMTQKIFKALARSSLAFVHACGSNEETRSYVDRLSSVLVTRISL